MLAVTLYLLGCAVPSALVALVDLGRQRRTRLLPVRGDEEGEEAPATATRVASFNVYGVPPVLRYATFQGGSSYDRWQEGVVEHVRRHASQAEAQADAIALQGAWNTVWDTLGPDGLFGALQKDGYYVTVCEATQLVGPGLAVATRTCPQRVRLYTFWRRELWQWAAGLPVGALAVLVGGRWVVSVCLSRGARVRASQLAALTRFCRSLADEGEVVLCGTVQVSAARVALRMRSGVWTSASVDKLRFAVRPEDHVRTHTFNPSSPTRLCVEPFFCKRWLCSCLPRRVDDVMPDGDEEACWRRCLRRESAALEHEDLAVSSERDVILLASVRERARYVAVEPTAALSPHALLVAELVREDSDGAPVMPSAPNGGSDALPSELSSAMAV